MRGGRRKHAGGLVIYLRPNGLDTGRLGVSVGKRFDKRSPRRNRMKRLIREAFRLNRSRLPAVDIVVVVRPGCRLDGLEAVSRALVSAAADRSG